MTTLTAGREKVMVLSSHPLQEYKEGVTVESLLVLPLQSQCAGLLLSSGFDQLDFLVIFKQTFLLLLGISISFKLFSLFYLLPMFWFFPLEASVASHCSYPHLHIFSQLLTQCQGDGRWVSLFCQHTRRLSKATTKHITSVETARCAEPTLSAPTLKS